MTHEEKAKIWNSLTDSEKKEAEAKKAEITKWAIEQENLITEKLKSEGKWKPGLDSNTDNQEIQEVNTEYKNKLNELLKEYGFAPLF